MKKSLYIFFVISLLVGGTNAQVIPSSDGGDYESRFTKLNKAYAKNPENVENLYNMALFYFDNSHPMRNLPMAMKYIQKAEARQVSLLDDNKIAELTHLTRKNITLSTIRQLKQSITDAAYNTLEVRTDMTRVELDTYLDAFGVNMDMVKLLRQRRINLIYDEDLKAGTIQSYYHFIDIYPGTREAEEMEERISKLSLSMFEGIDSEEEVDTIARAFRQSPSIQRAAEKHKSRLAYAEACRINTVQSYNDFLMRYPSSDEHLQARDKLNTLLEIKFASLRTAKEFADFVEANAENDLADSALVRLRELIYRDRDIQAARIYLNKFKLDKNYSQIYNLYYSWHSEEGNKALIEKFERENPNFPFQHLIEDDLEKASLFEGVNLLGDFMEADFGRYSGYVRQMMGKKIALVPLQRMIQAQLSANRYGSALERVRQFDLCFENVGKEEYRELVGILSAPPSGKKLSPVLSATYSITHTNFNPADRRMYYTRVGSAQSKICYATSDNGTWRPAGEVKFIGTDNSGLTLYGFFSDGSHMLFGKGGDVWIAEREGNEWRVTEIPPPPVNTDYIETDAYMLPDGSGMLIASDRPNGQNLQPSGSLFHGDTAWATDIYFVPYTQMGWGTPVNLGVNINTPYCERSPILSRNLKTLYFISDGRGGLGYGDVYMSTRSDVEDWTSWSEPVNIGREANTGFREAAVSFGNEEKTLLITSNFAQGQYACYSFPTMHNTENSYRTYPLDIFGMETFLHRLRVADMGQQNVVQVVEYSGSGASMDLNIHKEKRYAILGDAGIFFVPALIVDKNTKPNQKLKGYTFPVMVSFDKPIELRAVEFEEATTMITPIGQLQLEQLAQFIENNERCAVELVINVAGSDDLKCYNLSLERGRAIKDFLVLQGVDEDKVSISAYGNANSKRTLAAPVGVRFYEK